VQDCEAAGFLAGEHNESDTGPDDPIHATTRDCEPVTTDAPLKSAVTTRTQSLQLPADHTKVSDGQLKRLQAINSLMAGYATSEQYESSANVPFTTHTGGNRLAQPNDTSEPLKHGEEHAPNPPVNTQVAPVDAQPVARPTHAREVAGTASQWERETTSPNDVTHFTVRY
jgi:hypothetical protein